MVSSGRDKSTGGEDEAAAAEPDESVDGGGEISASGLVEFVGGGDEAAAVERDESVDSGGEI